MQARCSWVGPEDIYIAYHDTEWGVPEYGSRALWEKLILEGFQAGLSWITILKKRENFRRAFAGFDPVVIAGWGEDEVRNLLQDPGIVRHRGKIESAIKSARAWQQIEAETGFATYLWRFVDGVPLQNNRSASAEVPARTPLSDRISKDLKRRGFAFCGPTTVYAFMQAAGMVNDHLTRCPRHSQIAAMAAPRDGRKAQP